MRVISRKALRDFSLLHADSEDALNAWYNEATTKSWESPVDVKARYPSASILPGNRIVFNIKGNTYRLVVKVNYTYEIIFIRFVGTHSEYDKIDARTI